MGISHRYPYIVLMPQFVLSPILGIRFFTGGKAGKSRQDSDGGPAYHPL